jgi:hypothetical protein
VARKGAVWFFGGFFLLQRPGFPKTKRKSQKCVSVGWWLLRCGLQRVRAR